MMLVTVFLAVEDVFNLVLQIIIDFDGLRGWWGVAVDVIGLPRRETIDVKDRMLTH